MSKFYFLFTMGSLKNKLSKLNLGIIFIIKLINLGLNELTVTGPQMSCKVIE